MDLSEDEEDGGAWHGDDDDDDDASWGVTTPRSSRYPLEVFCIRVLFCRDLLLWGLSSLCGVNPESSYFHAMHCKLLSRYALLHSRTAGLASNHVLAEKPAS